MTTTSGNGGKSVKGVKRSDDQIYSCSFDDSYDQSIGAFWYRTTNLGQKSYTLRGGTGGTEIPAADLPEGYVSGTTADIPIVVDVSMNGQTVNTYHITVHRTYLEPEGA